MVKKLILVTFFLFSIGKTYCQVDLVSNLVAYYPLDNVNGANDIINGLNGTIFGVVTLTTDRFGAIDKAYEFGGEINGGDYIKIASNALLNFPNPNRSFSVSFWALQYHTTTGNDFMIAKGQDIAINSFGFRVNGRYPSFRLGLPNDEASLDTIIRGDWVSYVGSYDHVTSTMSFYVDGVLMKQIQNLTYTMSNAYPLLIGRHYTMADGSGGSPYPFRGKIDEIKIYSKVLNSCEAYAIANELNTCFGVNQGLAARYDFCSSAIDASGNGNNGTITGGAFVDDRFGNSLSAFSVDGINDYMRVKNDPSLNLNSKIAISAWYKADALASNTTNPILVKPGTPFDQYQLGVSGSSTDAFSMNMSIGSQNKKVTPLQSPYSWTINTWYHLVGVYDGTSKLTLYVNGRNLNTITISGTPDTFTQDLLIAANTITGNYLKGTIDDIRIYNRPFYKTDALALYHLAASTVACCSLPIPVANNLVSICGPGSITLTGSSVGTEAGTVIKWYNSSFNTILGTGNKLAIPLITSSGAYFPFNYYFGCQSTSAYVYAEIEPLPSVTGLNGSKSVCPNITNIGYGVNSVSGTTYKWFASGGTLVGGISTGDTVGVDWGGANSNAKVKVLPTNAYGCIGDTAIRNVTVNIVLKTETPIGDSIICLNKSTSLTYQIQPTNGSAYAWTVINAVTVLGPLNTNKITISPTLSGVTKLLVTETVPSMSQCYGQSDTLRLHVHPSPDTSLSIIGGNGVCINTPRVFSLNGFSTSTYNWTLTSGLRTQSQVNNSITVTSSATGINYLKVLEISEYGCVGKISTSTITTGRPFNTTIDGSQLNTLCTRDGVNAVYSVSGFNGSSYEWTSDNVNWTPIPDWTSFQTAYMLTAAGTGYLKVKETASTPNVCPGNKDSIFVRVFQSPTNNTITGRRKFCQNTFNEPYTLEGLPNSTYSWWIQQNTIKTGQGTKSVTIDFPISGTAKLTVLEITDHGCLGDSAATFMYRPIVINPTPIGKYIEGDSVFCTTNLDSAKFLLMKGFSNSKYYWQVLGGNSMILGRTDTNNIVVQLDSTNWQTRRWIKVLEISGQGCIGDTVKKFVRIDRPAADIKSVSVSETDAKTIELNYAPASHNATFVREPGTTLGMLFNTVQYLQNNLLTDSVIYQYQILEKDKCGKLFGSSTQENIVLKGKVDSTYGGAKLSWNPYVGWATGVKEYQVWRMIGDGGISEKYMTVTDSTRGDFVVANDGPVQIFRIKTIGNDPTRSSFSNPVRMIFNNVPKIYTGFTPNDDGINDTWIVDRLNLYPDNKVTVMDKWGTPVFEKTAYKGEWDGKKNGDYVPSGMYYYIIDLGQGHKPLAGTVSILR